MTSYNNFMTLNLISSVLLGVVIGYALGYFFSNRSQVFLSISKENLEKTLKLLNDVEEEASTETITKLDEENLIASPSFNKMSDLLEKQGLFFYKVNIPFLVIESQPDKAYYKTVKCIKGYNGNYKFRKGGILLEEVVVEKITDDILDKEEEA